MSLYHTSHFREPWAPKGVLAFCSTSHLSPKLPGDGLVPDSKQPSTVASQRTSPSKRSPGAGRPLTACQAELRRKEPGSSLSGGRTVPPVLPSRFSRFLTFVVFSWHCHLNSDICVRHTTFQGWGNQVAGSRLEAPGRWVWQEGVGPQGLEPERVSACLDPALSGK